MTTPLVLLVCLGNICRSPTAEAALREAADHAGVPLRLRSAGTGSWHVGEPPDARMCRAAAAQGLRLDGTAEQVDADLLRSADLVLAMDRANLRDLRGLARGAGVTTPIRLFREFDDHAAGELDVPDPYPGGAQGFTQVVDIARRTARRIVEAIDRGELATPRNGQSRSATEQPGEERPGS